MKMTRYFREEVVVKRPYLKMEWIAEVVAAPLKTETQEDGRIRYWGFVAEYGRVLRVVTLDDGTIHNAFPDRNFRKE
jgi:hypothetical protein